MSLSKPEVPRTYERIVRFRGLRADVRRDDQTGNDYVEFTIPCTELPKSFSEALKALGLKSGQHDEILEAVSNMTMMNFLMDHVDK